MPTEIWRPRDLDLIDAIDVLPREAFSGSVWRAVRGGRDPALGSPSLSRWCNGRFDVLYASMQRNGAIAEIHALLSLQPVFPSKGQWFAHKLEVAASQSLRLVDLAILARLGVDVARYTDRNYDHTQEIADTAYFLGFDGVIAPSARWECLNAMLFTDRLAPDQIVISEADPEPIDWDLWRKQKRR